MDLMGQATDGWEVSPRVLALQALNGKHVDQ